MAPHVFVPIDDVARREDLPAQPAEGRVEVEVLGTKLKAKPGDTILVDPGTYRFTPKNAQKWQYGLRIKTNNLRLIGKGKPGEVRLVYAGPDNYEEVVGAGVYAAPAGCDVDDGERGDTSAEELAKAAACKARTIKDFYIRGFTVEGFPRNGIQTRWVEGFEFIQNESKNNLNNGIYPTLSANGLVQNNVSYGSLDTAMWVAGSENVRVIGNDVSASTIGFEITVSNDVWVTQNKIYGNTLGVDKVPGVVTVLGPTAACTCSSCSTARRSPSRTSPCSCWRA